MQLLLTYQQLENFGPFLVKKLEDRLRLHCSENGVAFPEGETTESLQPPAKRQRTRAKSKREYIPAFRSGPYAVLMAFLEAEKVQINALLLCYILTHVQLSAFPGSLTKQELIALAEPFCNSSFTVPDAGTHYTFENTLENN